jgi:hypothetical protein
MARTAFSLGSPSSVLGRTMSLGGGPEFNLVGVTTHTDYTELDLHFSSPIDPGNPLLPVGGTYVFTPALTVISATLIDPFTIHLITSAQTPTTSYSVTVGPLYDLFLQTLVQNTASFLTPFLPSPTPGILPCNLVGWAIAPWGTAPWGGGGSPVIGGPLPTHPPFNVYCSGPCGEMSAFLTHPEVVFSPAADFTIDPVVGDVVITSNDNSEASLTINDAVTIDWTLEFTINAKELPLNFSNLANQHFFVGVADQDGSAAGLFFSQAGVAYAATFDASVQPLANSQTFFTTNDYYIIRLAVSTTTGTVYVFITQLNYFLHFGHQLRYVLPAIPYTATPQTAPEGTTILAKGISTAPTQVFLDELCLGDGLIIPNLPPIAEAGPDQVTDLCQIGRLDGSASFDPEGAQLAYLWRLIDAPIGSMYCFTGNDGTTYPESPPSGFANKMYSTGFQPPNNIPVVAGDVLLVGGKPYNCLFTGHDGLGYFVQIDGFDLPDNLTNVAYKILKQNGISGATTVRPTFFPDVPGFFKFDLQVFDGSLYSDPRAVTVVNVVISPLPRGVIPDLSFIWNYLSDFWKLLEDPDRISTIWGGIAQIAATELYTLWQTEYSKSLRDIQRTFNRRWLHYDLFLREPFIEITSNRFIFRGVDSASIPNTGIVITGQHLDLTGTYLPAISVPLTGVLLTPVQIAAQLQTGLLNFDSRFVVTVVSVDSTHSLIRINAPFAFSIPASNTFTVFGLGALNLTLHGTGGVLTNPLTYKTEISLLGLGLQTDDNLVVLIQPPVGSPYHLSVRIAGIVDSSVDTLRYQRIQLKDPLPQYATSLWQVPSKALSTQLDFWDGLVDTNDIGVYEIYDTPNQSALYFQVTVVAATESQTNTILFDVTPIADYLQLPSRFSSFFWGVYRRHYMPVESVIVDIPNLQRVIKDPLEAEVLRRNLDFFMDTVRGSTCIRFDESVWNVGEGQPIPVPRLWAEYTFLDNRPTVEANFGIPVQFTLDDLSQLPATVDYLSAVQGLWYSYLNGPTIFDLRVGTQVLLGLPFAEVTGVITEIRTDYSPNTGRILIQDANDPPIVREYVFPVTLSMEINPATGKTYVEGDTVQQFAPLVTGVSVLDWVNDPDWFQGYLSQGVFEEIQKFFTFSVKVNSAIFNLSALIFVKNFLYNIKPTYTSPLFVVEEDLFDTIEVTDFITLTGHLSLEVGAVYGVKQTTSFDSADPGPGRLVGGVPVPWSGYLSSHYVDAADTNTDADYPTNTWPSGSPPTNNTADALLVSGVDGPHLSPSQLISAFCSEVYAGGTPTPDGVIFRTGFPAYTGQQYGMGYKDVCDIPLSGVFLGDGALITGAQTLNCCEIFVEGIYDPSQGTSYHLEIFKNGVLNQTLSFTYNSTTRSTFLYTSYLATFTPIVVALNDRLTIYLVAVGGNNRRVFWNNFFVTLGTGQALGALSAGTYTRLQAL